MVSSTEQMLHKWQQTSDYHSGLGGLLEFRGNQGSEQQS